MSFDKYVGIYHFLRRDGAKEYQLLRVLKKNGQLLIVEFNPNTVIGSLIEFFENNIIRFGSLFYAPSELQKLFSHCRVEIFNSGSFCYVVKIMRK